MSSKRQDAEVGDAGSNGGGPVSAIANMTLPSPALAPAAIDRGAPEATLRDQDQRLKGAITAAHAVRPEKRGMHCLHCWGQGREDTIRAIRGALI